MRFSNNAPKTATWVVSLALFIIALLAHFGVLSVDNDIASWSWIIGFGLLLAACRVKGL